jgi:phosphatidylserine/phosphatidylglycerophosphate/cardiolipin synthase-like enzyme
MDEYKVELLNGTELHQRVIQQAVLAAEKYVWIATANLKDMHVAMARNDYKPILEVFDSMAKQGVTFRIVHSDMPSRPFRNTLERFPDLVKKALELQVCPRSHWKIVIVDGKSAYCGSANFTGAGLGAKNKKRRNLELGLFSENKDWVQKLCSLFDAFWIGEYCQDCAHIKSCPDPISNI